MFILEDKTDGDTIVVESCCIVEDDVRFDKMLICLQLPTDCETEDDYMSDYISGVTDENYCYIFSTIERTLITKLSKDQAEIFKALYQE